MKTCFPPLRELMHADVSLHPGFFRLRPLLLSYGGAGGSGFRIHWLGLALRFHGVTPRLILD